MDASLLQHLSFQSDDPDEVSEFIGRIYADNRFVAQHAVRKDVNMAGYEWQGIGIYEVDYQMPFHFHSDEARPNYLMLSCNRGGSTYRYDGTDVQCAPGDVMPISSTGNSTCTTSDEGFGHLSVIIDAEKVNDFVSQWIGRPLAEPLRFDLKTVSADVAIQWNMAADCLQRMLHMTPVPNAAAHSLAEHMLKILVTGHPNNYSGLLNADYYAAEHQVRVALGMITAEPTRWKTLGAVAHALNCPTSALEQGIRRQTGKSSAEAFHEARLTNVHRALARGDGQSFNGTLESHGFSASERFVSDYRRRFGESPSATYLRNPNAGETVAAFIASPDALCERTINQFIDDSLGKPISLSELADLVGKNEQAAIAAFKAQFSRTPMQYVIERRLERAIWLLRHTSASIVSIAIECGFGTQSYLTTAMKTRLGTTPRQIRLTASSSTQKASR
ncbi:helix-turn-helix domain-containing protein [Burkholderia cepacia]|uniref:helix-turn-helix domain-containing protein n=1 Tax=Burkholderia cepacia TaxID=292 RepID=UPI002FE266D6